VGRGRKEEKGRSESAAGGQVARPLSLSPLLSFSSSPHQRRLVVHKVLHELGGQLHRVPLDAPDAGGQGVVAGGEHVLEGVALGKKKEGVRKKKV
jgi:hypothetical protein